MKTITIAAAPAYVGDTIDLNNIPADMLEANKSIGKATARTYENDVIDFDPASLKAFKRMKNGKVVMNRAGTQPIIGVSINAEITANGQTRKVVLDLQNYIRSCNGVMLGDLHTIGTLADECLIENSKKFVAWINANPTKRLKVSGHEIEMGRSKDGESFPIEIPVLMAV